MPLGQAGPKFASNFEHGNNTVSLLQCSHINICILLKHCWQFQKVLKDYSNYSTVKVKILCLGFRWSWQTTCREETTNATTSVFYPFQLLCSFEKQCQVYIFLPHLKCRISYTKHCILLSKLYWYQQIKNKVSLSCVVLLFVCLFLLKVMFLSV